MTLPAPRHDALKVGLLLLAWLAASAWLRPLTLPDEGRYVGVAFEMLRSGDWLTPKLNGMPFFHKPPLLYWLNAAGLGLFGLHEAAARLGPLLGALAAGLALYLFLRRWAGHSMARLGLVALAVQPLYFVGAQFSNMDMLVAGCISASILAGAHALLCAQAALAHRRFVLLAYALAALGVLAKGLIGVVIPAAVLLGWLVWRRQWRGLLSLLWWPGPLLLLAMAAPWFWAMQQGHPGFVDYFFMEQHVRRFAQGGFNNAHPIWFYPAVLALLCLPWLPWLLRGLRLKPTAPAARSPLHSLWWIWVGVVLVFFSLPQSKLVGYILPLVPPLAALMAAALGPAGTGSPRLRRWWAASAGVSAAAGCIGVAVLAWQTPHSSRALALILRDQIRPGEPVLMLGGYRYDLAFYARLTQPVGVAEDWSDPDIPRRDNWRKELADAGRFDPAAAAKVLVPASAFVSQLCTAAVTWVVAPNGHAAMQGLPLTTEQRASINGLSLWRVAAPLAGQPQPPGCAGTPNADSARR